MDTILWILLILSGVLGTLLFHAFKDVFRLEAELNKSNHLYHEARKECAALGKAQLQHAREKQMISQFISRHMKENLEFANEVNAGVDVLIAQIEELKGTNKALENAIKNEQYKKNLLDFCKI